MSAFDRVMNAAPRLSANFGANVGARNLGSPVSVASVAANTSNAAKQMGGLLSGWGGILLVIVVLMALFAIYYQTIGYYIQIGWEKLGWSRAHGERVEIAIPGGPSAELTPAAATVGSQSKGSSLEDSLSGVLSSLETDVESALGGGSLGKQVFHVHRNLYTFGEAEPLCRAFGAELATYDQVKEAYNSGADWCNYGWVKGQLAVYPTQKSTYDKLQAGPESERMTCGMPGVNGGFFPNAEQRFGVTCYGQRPPESALDQRVQMEERPDLAVDREVNRFKAELDSIPVTPWNSEQWSK
jgi:hypothetical protein